MDDFVPYLIILSANIYKIIYNFFYYIYLITKSKKSSFVYKKKSNCLNSFLLKAINQHLKQPKPFLAHAFTSKQ